MNPLLRTACIATFLFAPISARAQFGWREVPELTARRGHSIAYDPIRDRVVLFGGEGIGSGGTHRVLLNDTWEWDGRKWRPLQDLALRPPPRTHASMAFDPTSRKVLLFAGADPQKRIIYRDTWQWDGQRWTQLAPRTSPPPRWASAMAADRARGRIVLFGGLLTFFAKGPIAAADTWTWDGSTWMQQRPRTVPDPRSAHVMAYHAPTRCVVMFGGTIGVIVVPPHVWEWDGTDWTKRAVPPPERSWGMGMAPDPLSGHLVLLVSTDRYKGFQMGTWEWNGRRWRKLMVGPRPTHRWSQSLVTDRARGRVVMFGGWPPNGRRWQHSDTWTWDGRDWSLAADWRLPDTLEGSWGSTVYVAHDAARDQFVFAGANRTTRRFETWVMDENRWRRLRPPTSPPDRWTPGIVYHPGIRKVVLYGGWRTSYDLRTDTWLWDGRTWTEHRGKAGPRTLSDLVYEAHRDKILLFAGETWEWDFQTGWSRRQPKKSPPVVAIAGLAYDPVRKRTVYVSDAVELSRRTNVWEWDGNDWHEIVPKTRPPKANWSHVEYVPALHGVVLLGGTQRLNVLPDTWVWDGKDWHKLAISPPPTVFRAMPMMSAYDSNRQRLRVFYRFWSGGRPASTAWDLVRVSLTATQPYPRPGQSLRAEVHLPAQKGNPFLLALALTLRPGIPLRPVPGVGAEMVPLAPDPLFWLSLQAAMVTRLDAQGKAKLPLVIPNDKALLWLDLFAAGLSFDATGIGAITNPLALQIVK